MSSAIKAVASYEIIKGLSALCAALALWRWHTHLLDWLGSLQTLVLVKFGTIFAAQTDAIIRVVEKADQNWQLFLLGILGYAALRFIEAYGLWHDKTWAYWFGILGYGLFIPLEMYYLVVRPFDWLKLAVLILNIVVVTIVYRKMRQKGLI